MTEPPFLARAMLRVAELLAPATDRLWVDAMRGDLDAAHGDGRALSWAFGCFIAALRLRGAATFLLMPRWRRALFGLFVMLFFTGTSMLGYRAISGAWPFHSALGYLLALVPILAVCALAFLRAPAVDERWVRGSLLLIVLASALLGLSTLMLLAGGGFWASLAAAFATAPILLVCSAFLGTFATLTATILLSANFRKLPRRIPRVLPFEHRFVYFWGANREKMLALADAGTNEMTLPRGWLVYSTVFTTFLFLQAAEQIITASAGHALGMGHERFLAYSFVGIAVLCGVNMLHVIAHLRFSRQAH